MVGNGSGRAAPANITMVAHGRSRPRPENSPVLSHNTLISERSRPVRSGCKARPSANTSVVTRNNLLVGLGLFDLVLPGTHSVHLLRPGRWRREFRVQPAGGFALRVEMPSPSPKWSPCRWRNSAFRSARRPGVAEAGAGAFRGLAQAPPGSPRAAFSESVRITVTRDWGSHPRGSLREVRRPEVLPAPAAGVTWRTSG